MSELAVQSRSITEHARGAFSPEQVSVIRNTVARDASDAELAMFLELCARYELDPFAGQLYCAKMPGQNGQPGRMAIIAGRDTFLTIANRNQDFGGFDSDVVRQNDTYRFERDERGHPRVTHTYEGGPKVRGAIIGAWCIAYRNGRRPRYFFADVDEYMPASPSSYSPWKKQRSVMIEKCAISTALRLAYSITGLIGEEEAAHQLESPTPEDFDYAENPHLAARLAAYVEAANAIRPGAFRVSKVRMLLRGKDDAEREQVAQEIADFIVKHGGDVPEVPEVIDLEAEDDAEAEAITTDEAEAAAEHGEFDALDGKSE
jgi:phage recombination protein Bet